MASLASVDPKSSEMDWHKVVKCLWSDKSPFQFGFGNHSPGQRGNGSSKLYSAQSSKVISFVMVWHCFPFLRHRVTLKLSGSHSPWPCRSPPLLKLLSQRPPKARSSWLAGILWNSTGQKWILTSSLTASVHELWNKMCCTLSFNTKLPSVLCLFSDTIFCLYCTAGRTLQLTPLYWNKSTGNFVSLFKTPIHLSDRSFSWSCRACNIFNRNRWYRLTLIHCFFCFF